MYFTGFKKYWENSFIFYKKLVYKFKISVGLLESFSSSFSLKNSANSPKPVKNFVVEALSATPWN